MNTEKESLRLAFLARESLTEDALTGALHAQGTERTLLYLCRDSATEVVPGMVCTVKLCLTGLKRRPSEENSFAIHGFITLLPVCTSSEYYGPASTVPVNGMINVADHAGWLELEGENAASFYAVVSQIFAYFDARQEMIAQREKLNRLFHKYDFFK